MLTGVAVAAGVTGLTGVIADGNRSSTSIPWIIGSPYLTGVPPIRLLRPARPDPAGRPHGALAAAPFLATFRDRLRRARSLPPGGAAEDRGPVRRVAVPASVSFIRRLRFPQADPLPGF